MLFKEFVREVNREENEKENAKAREEGKSEGISIGLEQGKARIAKQMLLEQEPMDKIVKYTGLSKEVITNSTK